MVGMFYVWLLGCAYQWRDCSSLCCHSQCSSLVTLHRGNNESGFDIAFFLFQNLPLSLKDNMKCPFLFPDKLSFKEVI